MIPNSNANSALPVDVFFRGAFSIDMALLTYREDQLMVLLQRKNEEPFVDVPGLPGKLILPNEDTDAAIDHLLSSLIGTDRLYKKQLRAFSAVDRHPMGRVISFAYYGLLPNDHRAELNNERLLWCALDAVPQLSYDHNTILKHAIHRFKKGLLRHPNVFELLPKEFTIPEVIAIFEQAFDQKLNASNFAKLLKKSNLLVPLNRHKKGIKDTGRPPMLYTFDRETYRRHPKDRIHFHF